MTPFTADSASIFLNIPLKTKKMSLFGLWNCGSLTCYAPEMKVGHLPFP